MMKAILLVATMLLAGAVHADEGHFELYGVHDNSLLGNWVSAAPIVSNSTLTVHLGVNFKPQNAVITSYCTFPNGSKLEASVTVPVHAEKGKIDVLGEAQSETKAGGNTCPVAMEKGTVPYAISGNILKMTAVGRTVDFVKK